MSEPTVRTFPDSAALSTAAAAAFVDVVVAAQKERGTASVVLTGGGTGIATLKALRENSGDVDWSAVHVFFGDERFLPEGDGERNYVQARAALLDHVPVDADLVHAMASSDGPLRDDIDVAAATYLQAIAAFAAPDGEPTFDIHLLGMGGEGHINSLFPHTDAVRESERLVIAVTDSPKPPPRRITLTLPAVRRARQVWFLVAGEEKAEAAAAAINGASAEDWPSAGAKGIDETVWFLDEAAASQL
ncbi:6-phosphogluconolactonase [Rhodococcoides trifolii]|uniref:6-phosphogluconolactonase n=1 Tax=Rhodococcoides trifolii TaxID=908250 RepID=A0A917FUA2_9NOCA|nr:6-phosphogluconolactonase [Rhodococcus trifolii]GGG09503.1 6-phosphogluconolactonase [Rhodococcus trifolii]